MLHAALSVGPEIIRWRRVAQRFDQDGFSSTRALDVLGESSQLCSLRRERPWPGLIRGWRFFPGGNAGSAAGAHFSILAICVGGSLQGHASYVI